MHNDNKMPHLFNKRIFKRLLQRVTQSPYYLSMAICTNKFMGAVWATRGSL